MSSTFTPNKGYELQATGENNGTWGVKLDSVESIIDLNLGGRLNLNVGGNVDINVSSAQAQNVRHVLTGVLTGNINYKLPNAGSFYIITNNTTGAFNLTLVNTGGGAGIVLPQGATVVVFVNPDTPGIEQISSSVSTGAGAVFNVPTTAGSANVQTATFTPAVTLQAGLIVSVIVGPGLTNTGPLTLNANGTGAKAVTTRGANALIGGEWVAAAQVLFGYDGTRWQILGGATPQLNTPNTFNADQTIQASTAGAGVGPNLNLIRNKGAAAAANDLLAAVNWQGENSTPAAKNFGSIIAKVIDPTAGTEDGELRFQTIVAGTPADRAVIGQGVYSVSAVGGDKGADSANFKSYYVDGGTPLWGFRNVLINGGFQVWQRGTSVAVAASTVAYTADRWYLATGANQAFTVSQQAGHACRVQRNSGQTGTGAVVFAQPLDSDVVADLAGGNARFTIAVTTGANWMSGASGNLVMKVYCGTGSPAKRNATPYTGESNPISVTTSVAASAGNTVLTGSGAIPSNTTQIEVQLTWSPTGTAGANDWLSITTAQLEPVADTTTPYSGFDLSRLNFPSELAFCQRYYEKSFPYATAPAQNVGSVAGCQTYTFNAPNVISWDSYTPFRTVKRVSPTVTTYSPNTADANWRNAGNSQSNTASITAAADGSVLIHGNANGALVTWYIHWAADAEI